MASNRRIQAMQYCAHGQAEALAIVSAATFKHAMLSHYKWIAAELNVDRRQTHELQYFHGIECRLLTRHELRPQPYLNVSLLCLSSPKKTGTAQRDERFPCRTAY